MENYTKGDVVEVDEPPIFPVDETGVHMKVNGGSKISNIMRYALNKMKEASIKQVSWNGSGNAVAKTVSCAEIMKRRCKGLHQMTKVRYRRVEEYWEPQIAGLERLKVNRDIPAISILLSKVPLDKTEPGYQAPGSFDELWKEIVTGGEKRKPKRPRGPTDSRYRGEYYGREDNTRRGKDNRKDKQKDNRKQQNNWRQKNSEDRKTEGGKCEKRKVDELKVSESNQTAADGVTGSRKVQKSETARERSNTSYSADSKPKDNKKTENNSSSVTRETESMEVSPVVE